MRHGSFHNRILDARTSSNKLLLRWYENTIMEISCMNLTKIDKSNLELVDKYEKFQWFVDVA